MKIFSLILCFFIFPAQADSVTPSQLRLAMGFYYPALNNVSNKTDIEISLNYWVKELASTLIRKNVYSVLYDDIATMSSDFRSGKLDMVIAPPLLLAMYFDRDLLSDGFVGVTELNKLDYVSIIIRQEAGQGFDGYKGKKLLLPKNDLLAGMFLELEVLKQYQRPYRQVFSQITQGSKNQRMILDVFFGKVDVAVVYGRALELMIEMNPQLATKIKVLKKMPVKAINYAYFHRDYAYQEALKKEAYRFSSEVRGKQILEVFHSSDIDVCLVSELKSFDVFYQKYLGVKGAQTHD